MLTTVGEVTFSYSVYTVNDKTTEWAHRMDHYWKMGSGKVHYMQIFVSLLIITMVAMIICQIFKCALKKDFRSLELGVLSLNKHRRDRGQRRADGDEQETSGLTETRRSPVVVEAENVAWKKIQGDVMRAPGYPNIFACLIGIGCQIFFTTYLTLIYILVFFAAEGYRPYVFNAGLFILACVAWVNGYVTCRTLKFFGATDWVFSAAISAVTMPCFLYMTLSVSEMLEALVKAGQHYTFTHEVFYALAWCLANGVLSFVGAYYGYLQQQLKKPIRVSAVKRTVPPQPYIMNLVFVGALVGVIQFATVFTEFKYLIESVWRNQMYAMFGFLFVNFLLHAVTTCLLAVVQTYLTLSYQNYEWWWRSFWTGASGSVFVGAYAIYYLMTVMDITSVSSDLVYILYTQIFVIFFGIMSGMISVFASYLFIEFLYSNIKGE